MILVVDNYDSFTYNLVQLLSALGAEVEVRRNDTITAEEALALEPAGIVVSPGPGTPEDAGISRDVIRAAADAGVPLLGVCLGHQCIAEVFGGTICRAPRPVHGKTDEITHDGRFLFAGIPSPFTATRYHSLCVDAESVPAALEVQATTPDGVVMGLHHRELPIFGVQFHPESVLTPEGAKLLANFLDVTGEVPLSRGVSGTPAIVSAAGGTARASAGTAEITSVGGAIARVATGASLTEDEARLVMDQVMDGEATPSQISALITGMRMKGETVDEIVGFARSMRAHATPVRPTVAGYIDTCGTGGDGLHTFNISTTTAFVVAGAGVPVAKHGNRAVSSAAGSADVLEALGIDISLSAAGVARCIDEAGVGFLFAQALHASMRHAGPTRREIGIRTVFNILGPLTNPAGAKRQLLGVYDPALAPVMAEVAGRLGAERVLVVHGHPGMDEVSASGPSTIAEFDAAAGDGTAAGKLRVYEVTPESVGLARGTLADIAGGDAAENAAIVRHVLEGEVGPRRDVVLMNAAAALLAAGKAPDLAEGVTLARDAIDSGRATAALEALVAISQRIAAEERVAVGAAAGSAS
jgi:anthranilate synthase/phosphoribosyltransferase